LVPIAVRARRERDETSTSTISRRSRRGVGERRRRDGAHVRRHGCEESSVIQSVPRFGQCHPERRVIIREKCHKSRQGSVRVVSARCARRVVRVRRSVRPSGRVFVPSSSWRVVTLAYKRAELGNDASSSVTVVVVSERGEFEKF